MSDYTLTEAEMAALKVYGIVYCIPGFTGHAQFTLEDGRTRCGRAERSLLKRGYIADSGRMTGMSPLYSITDEGRAALAAQSDPDLKMEVQR